MCYEPVDGGGFQTWKQKCERNAQLELSRGCVFAYTSIVSNDSAFDFFLRYHQFVGGRWSCNKNIFQTLLKKDSSVSTLSKSETNCAHASVR
jgi:hypothetical protein